MAEPSGTGSASSRASPTLGERQPPRISVVVSTCNRAADLPLLFEALDRQTINGRITWELVLVDNRSTDDSARVIDGLAGRASYPVRQLYEGRQGKSYGLNAGIRAARGAIIAFTDDDGIPAPDWLERLQAHFDEHPDAACVGGRVELHDPADAPITIRLSREPRIVDAAGFAAFDIPVIGCNMAIRAALLDKVGPFDVSVGPGARAGTAEDVDILYRLVSAGHRIHYDPAVLVFHNHGRRSADEVARVRTSYLVGRGAFYCKHMLKADRTVWRWAYWELRALSARAIRTGVFTRPARGNWHDLRMIATGAVRYLRYRQPEPAPSARPRDEGGTTNA